MEFHPLHSKFSVVANQAHSHDLKWMRAALEEAEQGGAKDEVPIGAVLVIGDAVVSKAHNSPITSHNACAHAEIQAIEMACKAVGNYRLGSQATLYVTLQPCLMCLGAILHARIGRVVVGCEQSRFNVDLKGALEIYERSEAWHPCRFETGCLASECEHLLTRFFKAKRKQREQALAELTNLMHLPNVNKGTLAELARLGIQTPGDVLSVGLEETAQRLQQRSLDLKGEHTTLQISQEAAQQAAILISLCDYLRGEPVRSWKQYQ